MAKSENKKFLIIFAAFFAAVALLCAAFGTPLAKADGETPQQTAAELKETIEANYEKIRGFGFEIDKGNLELKKQYGYTKDLIDEGKDITAYLSGNIGLNGISKIAAGFIDFYNSEINRAGITKEAKEAAINHVDKFKVSDYRKFDYDSMKADDFFKAFVYVDTNSKNNQQYKDRIARVYDEYFSVNADRTSEYVGDDADGNYKYYFKYIQTKLPDVDFDRTSELNKKNAEIDDYTNPEDWNSIASAYEAKFKNVYRFIEYLDNEIITKGYDGLHVNNNYDSFAEKKSEALRLAEICEDAIADAKKFYDNDQNSKSHIKSMYVNICKDGVDAVRSGLAKNFGPSAYDKITANRDMAYALIESVTAENNLSISSRYYYTKDDSADSGLVFKASRTVEVNTGKDVINAFEDSYTVNGALKSNGKSSSKPTPKSSTIIGRDEAKTVTITLTAVGDDDNEREIPEFDVGARLEVRIGTTPTIERNINTILAKKDLADRISDEVSDKETLAKEIANKHVQYFYTLTVYEGDVVREDFDGRYRITIEYADDVLSEYANGGFYLINYYHTEITGVAKNQIETEGKKIMFYTDNFAQVALLSDVEWVDLAKWVLLGVVGFIVLVWLILLVIYLVKNRKFTVIFNANGGRPTTHIRLKHKEKFAYPKNPTRRGHVFMGWFTTRKCDVRFASTEMLNKKRFTVYAKWITEEQYKALIAESEEERVPVMPVREEPVEKVEEKAEEKIEEKIEETVEKPVVIPVVEPVAEETVEEKTEETVEETVEETAEEPAEEPADEVEEEPVKDVEEPIAEEPAFDVVGRFDELKSEIFSYEKANDLNYGLELSKSVCSIKVVGETIEIEVALDKDELTAKGFNVVGGDKLASKFVIKTEEDYKVAEELVEEVMYENGLKKSDKAVITTATEITKEEGFVRTLDSERLAENAEEYFKLLRVYAKSFVKPDGDKGEDKPLLKMFMVFDRVNLYLNYFADGMAECDEAIKAAGYRSLVVVRDAAECAKAEEYIRAMMKENGLVRYPIDVLVSDSGTDKGFAYTLKY